MLILSSTVDEALSQSQRCCHTHSTLHAARGASPINHSRARDRKPNVTRHFCTRIPKECLNGTPSIPKNENTFSRPTCSTAFARRHAPWRQGLTLHTRRRWAPIRLLVVLAVVMRRRCPVVSRWRHDMSLRSDRSATSTRRIPMRWRRRVLSSRMMVVVAMMRR